MPLFSRRTNNRASLQATGHSLEASASLPNSGFVFIDNAQGASAAVAELSQSVDFSLDRLETDEGLTSQAELQLQRLEKKAGEYLNSRLEHVNPVEHRFTSDSAELVTHMESGLQELRYVDRSKYGINKAIALYKAVPNIDGVPILVVAIRGSKHRVDHMVNANHAQKSVDHFVSGVSFGVPNEHNLGAHKGFLGVAKAMEEDIAKLIQPYKFKHVVFTGHSAGGAVASLLYLRSFSWPQQDDPFKYSLITFGAPPIVTFPISIPQHATGALVLNIINANDIVPRADRSYILSLVDLLRSIYNLPPVSASTSHNGDPKPYWPLPKPDYYHVGERIVLQDRVVEEDLANSDELDDGANDRFQFLTWRVSPESFGRLVFCSRDAHRRDMYTEQVEKLQALYCK